jgi:hypothetical protein
MRVESSLQLVLNVRLPARTRGRRLRAELEAWHVEPWMASLDYSRDSGVRLPVSA